MSEDRSRLKSRFLVCMSAAFLAGLLLSPTLSAAQHAGQDMQTQASHHCKHHQRHGSKGTHPGHQGHGCKRQGHGGHHGCGGKMGRHGGHHGHAAHHGKKLFGPHWRTTLSPEQANELDRLRVEHAKRKMPLKAKAKAIKLELTALATADEPGTSTMDARIDELLAVKGEMLKHKYAHIAAMRKVLTPEQRVSFDMDVLKRSKQKGKKHR
ncbi:MAG: periplasmic heavy metal sensor [Gammaproteobacteria bacterium]|nr:periplasmic heavy metal sensor [Gammaproteobacteria bacterium]